MRYDVDVNGTHRQVTIERRDGRLIASVGGHEWVVDAASVGPHTLSLLLEEVQTSCVSSHELSIAADPVSGQFVFGVRGVPVTAGLSARRRWGSRDDGDAGSSPQRVVAPMPGKILRVLARPGDLVRQRQSVVVVEAMKMENELRAARDGKVVELLVQEGQSVEAGALLAIIAPQ